MSEYRGPSWSWVSLDGLVMYGTIMGETIGIRGPSLCCLTVISKEVNCSTLGPMGQVPDGALKILDLLQEATWFWRPEEMLAWEVTI